jgi:predicted SAM-dependent methyltransferase
MNNNVDGVVTRRSLVHLGCGPSVKKTRWMDLDGSWNARLNHLPPLLRQAIRGFWRITGVQRVLVFPQHVRYLNLNRSLPYPADSVDAIYASHVWEHLHLNVAKRITVECARILKPGGILRVVVPDVRVFIKTYQESDADDAAVRLNEALGYQDLERVDSLFRRFYVALTQLHQHKFMYDDKYLIRVFVESGFVHVSRRECFDSGIPEIPDVESPHRCSSTAGFAIEGTKP